ncbi:hypothetical protein PGB90_006818 [Kerria lacca]
MALSSTTKWTVQQCVTFFNIFQRYPILWDANHVDIKNALKRETVLTDLKTKLEENNFLNSKLAWFSAVQYLRSGNITRTAKENVDFKIVGTNDSHEENVDDDLLSVTHSSGSITSSNSSKKKKGYDDNFEIWEITIAMKTLEKIVS